MQQQEFDRRYCRKLNPQQLEAVHSVDGPTLLLAVPGSGKTTVLVTRLGYMLLVRGIEPGRILTMTYTVAATADMRGRFAELFGPENARQMEFYTINGLAARIMEFYSRHHGRAEIPGLIENDEAAGIIAGLYQQLSGEYATDSLIKDIRTAITYIKNMMLTADELEKAELGIEHIQELYQGYQAALRQRKLMDFDDQLSFALTILRRYPTVLEHFQDRFPYICVDESQDTSRIQHEIIKLLSKKYGNIFMVGDEDQSIYGFRAAYPEALLEFEREHEGARVLLMEQNYRSTGEIVSAADAFIAKNKNRHPKSLKAVRGSGAQLQLIDCQSRGMQYAWLFEAARRCSRETAVLYRNNDSALPLIDLMERRGVSYNCKRFEDSFFSHRVLMDIRDIICFAHEPGDAQRFMRIYYKMGQPISRIMAEEACLSSLRSGGSIISALEQRMGGEGIAELSDVLRAIAAGTAEQALVHIWKSLKYSAYTAKNGLDAGKYEILCQLARREKGPMDLLRRLDELREIVHGHVNSPDVKLLLSTVHSSKGLEYERVYLADMFDGILPSKKKAECRTEDELRQYEEDRRIFYVAMTRAKDELYFFNCADRAGEFVSELMSCMPAELVDEKDIFAPMKQPMRGRSYRHREKGRGRVEAQCGDMLLISYPGQEPELDCLAELMAQRDMKAEYAAIRTEAAPPIEPEFNVDAKPGMKLMHKRFGQGTVIFVKDGIASIAFSKEHGTKKIVLATAFKNGILSAE